MIDRSKSNLKIKQKTKKKKETNKLKINRRQVEKQLLENVNIIFGIDNGVTGTVACILPEYSDYIDILETPVIESENYTQDVQKINRINIKELSEWIKKHLNFAKKIYKDKIKSIVILERPMVNPQRFKNSLIAIRAFEATLITLESLELNYIIIDSKKWQHHFFGKDTTQIDLKRASLKLSLDILEQNKESKYYVFEDLKKLLEKHGDGDAFLIGYYIKEKTK
jgi:hypothetical protein